MPARKPNSLIRSARTKQDKSAREASENALTPKIELSTAVPAALKGHVKASTVWKHRMKIWQATDGTIVTAHDDERLVEYCLGVEEMFELMKMRADIKKDWERLRAAAAKIKPTPENLKEWVRAWKMVNAKENNFKQYDARLDGKKKYLMSLAQSMYLTPRSRAGVAPAEKPPEEPQDDMERLLGEE